MIFSNILIYFVVIPLVMLGLLFLCRDIKQVRTVAVIGSTALVALSVYLLFDFLHLRQLGADAPMLYTGSWMWFEPLNIHLALGVDGISVAMILLSAIIVFAGTFASWKIDHSDGAEMTFRLGGHDSKWHNKLVGMRPEVVDGQTQMVEYRPLDFSITKNVCAIFIACLLVMWMVLDVAAWYRKKGYTAPRRATGAIEALIEFIYYGVIKPTLGAKSRKFGPYLLTVFFFILVANLLGLMVIFPGGANITGNIAVTLVLSLITFLIVNIFGTKHYWKEVFWPDVPLWLKFPIPIMPVIELFGVFTKPAALTVRLFANMMGGHIIVIVLTLLIFILGALGAAAAGGTLVVSLIFSVFMLLIDVLVSFIQAYVFTMLSTVFIGLAQEDGHHGKDAHEVPAAPTTTRS